MKTPKTTEMKLLKKDNLSIVRKVAKVVTISIITECLFYAIPTFLQHPSLGQS